jgi:RHS repeat-associated protein
VISETDGSGNLKREYVYANGKLVVRMEPSARYFYHTDPSGTPLAITDTAGSVVWRADYRPFGEEHLITGTKENDLRFVGKEKDQETGLLYFGARYMEAMIGRFLSTDPVGAVDPKTGKVNTKTLLNPQRLNYYAYGLNNPYRYIDPDGMWPTEFKQVHQASIERVLRHKLSGGNINILNRQQVIMDNDRAYSHPNLHGLSMPGQDPSDAWRIANSFVRDSLEMARELEKRGQHHEALRHLGNAIHTMQDVTSPAHQGYQTWNESVSSREKWGTHTSREFFDPGPGSALDAATQRAWNIFRSTGPIPMEVLKKP